MAHKAPLADVVVEPDPAQGNGGAELRPDLYCDI